MNLVEMNSILFLLCFVVPQIWSNPLGIENHVLEIPLSYSWLGYITEIGIGTPPQPFNVEISTLEKGLWVSSAYCTDSWHDGCKERNGFNSSFSSSFVEDGRKAVAGIDREDTIIQVSGFYAKDHVTIPNNGREIKLNDITFGQMVNVPKQWYEQKNVSGSLGMGMINNKDGWSIIDSLAKSSVISSKVVGFNIKRVKMSGLETCVKEAGKLTIGSPVGDISLVDANPIWVYAQEVRNYSLLRVMGMNIMSKPIHCTGSDGCLALLSTSSPFIKLPEAQAFRMNNLLGMIPNFGKMFATYCNRIEYLPNIDVVVGSITVSIPPSDYLLGPEESQELYRNEGYLMGEGENEICLSWLLPYAEDGLIVLGQPFLQNVYTLFDYEKKKFGFANYK